MADWQLEGSLDETEMVRMVPITDFPFVIGRSKSLDMVILRSGISREHAEIFRKSGRLYIRDLGSTNGTMVNNERISSDTFISHNSIIHFSDVEFKLIDLEHDAPKDELLTMVVDVSARAAKRAPASNSASQKISPPKDQSSNVPNSKGLGLQESGALSEIDLSQASPSHAEPASQQGVPRYAAHEKVFVQGGVDHANRRLQPRREARWPARFTLENQQSVQCVTKDFSEAGLSFTSPVKLAKQSLIEVTIQIFYKGKHRDFSILGVVKHSLLAANGFIVGIHIKQCSESCSEFIRKYTNHII